MLKLLLKKLNFEADTAENGRVAVEMILRNPEQYYLVFMDNLMPELVRQTDRHLLLYWIILVGYEETVS